MADVTVLGLSANASPTSSDLVGVWSVGGASFNKSTIAQIAAAMGITGGGQVATGGFTLTVPATGTAALLQSANVFTTTNSISPTNTGHGGLAINMPASTGASALGINYNGGARFVFTANPTANSIIMADADMGSENLGSGLYLGRNSAAAQPGAGFIRFTTNAGAARYYWVDVGGHLRLSATAPAFSDDEQGEVILTDANFAVTNTFTALQNINPTSTITGALSISMPASTGGNAIVVNYIAARFFLVQRATVSQLIMSDADLGADAPAPGLYLGRNSNATTPTSGFIRFTAKNGVDYYVWVGSDGKLHINSSVPTNAIDVSATIVGTQS